MEGNEHINVVVQRLLHLRSMDITDNRCCDARLFNWNPLRHLIILFRNPLCDVGSVVVVVIAAAAAAVVVVFSILRRNRAPRQPES